MGYGNFGYQVTLNDYFPPRKRSGVFRQRVAKSAESFANMSQITPSFETIAKSREIRRRRADCAVTRYATKEAYEKECKGLIDPLEGMELPPEDYKEVINIITPSSVPRTAMEETQAGTSPKARNLYKIYGVGMLALILGFAIAISVKK